VARTPLGLVWSGTTLFVSARGRVYAFTHLVGHRFGKRAVILDGHDPKAANNTILVLPNGRLLISVSATCDHCRQTSRYSAAIVTFDRNGGRLRVYARGIRDGYGLALYPGTSTPLVSINQRDDLGAHARRLARGRPAGSGLGLPELLRPGRLRVPRRPQPTRRARPPRRGRRSRHLR
jgi:glucose/arabinose dehydrogenase